jgi:Integrase core domain
VFAGKRPQLAVVLSLTSTIKDFSFVSPRLMGPIKSMCRTRSFRDYCTLPIIPRFRGILAPTGCSPAFGANYSGRAWRWEFYEAVRQCDACARSRISDKRHTNPLQLFPANGPMDSVAMGILGSLPRTTHGNIFLLVIADRFSKVTITVPLRTFTALSVATAFCDRWVYVYGPRMSLLTDNGTQFAAKFLQEVCAELGVNKLFTSAYHPKTTAKWSGITELFWPPCGRTLVNAKIIGTTLCQRLPTRTTVAFIGASVWPPSNSSSHGHLFRLL